MKSLYLLINLLSVAYPLASSFERRIRFASKWKAWLPAILLPASIFIILDEVFTRAAYWGFNPDYLLGWYIGSLPIEEILFFICIPYACLFIYESLRYFKPTGFIGMQSAQIVSSLLILCFTLFGFYFSDRVYSFTWALFAALLLFIVRYLIKPSWLPLFISSFIIALVPFFVVNGLLTGTGIEEEVVWYSKQAISGYRMLSIPVEDTAYACCLILCNLLIYEFRLKRA